MPRPRLSRRVGFEPGVTYFKPAGVRMTELEESVLTVDEFEAVRLKDLQGLSQEECAKRMKISQPTFHRLVLSARKKIADAVVNGKAIRIQGGNFKMVQPGRRRMRIRAGAGGRGSAGMGRARRGRQGRGMPGGGMGFGGPAINCVCPKCNHKEEKKRGVPCAAIKCPKCGTVMIRGE